MLGKRYETYEDAITIALIHSEVYKGSDLIFGLPTIGTVCYLAPQELGRKPEIKLYENGKFKNWDTLGDEVQYNIFSFIQDNINDISLYIQERVIEVESVDNLEWVVNPSPIIVPDGNSETGSTTIGFLAVGKEQTPEGEIRPVIFIGADKTWTTLSVFRPEDVNSVAVMRSDLQKIAEEILNFTEKL